MAKNGRKPKPARIWMRKDDERWLILDRGKQIPTGARGRTCEPDAEKALIRYLAQQHFDVPPIPQPLSNVSVDAILQHYLCNLREDMVAPERQAIAVKSLMKFWTRKNCADINRLTCKAFVTSSTSISTARRDLGVLGAALGMALVDGLIHSKPRVWRPKERPPKDRWLTRQEVAELIRQLRRDRRSRHAAFRVLCGFYTGSRRSTLAHTTWLPRNDGPWVDLVRGIWWRSGRDEEETSKRRQPHAIPPRLLRLLRLRYKAMLRRAQKGGRTEEYVFEHPRHPGKPLIDIGKSLATACEKLGVEPITEHTLKHTAITNAIRDGMKARDAASYFSTSKDTIDRTYWHNSPDFQQRQTIVMDNLGRDSNETQRNE